MPRPTAAALALTATLLAAAAGCSSGSPTEVARPEPSRTYVAGDVPVLVPGAPGEPAEVVQPGQTGTIPNSDSYGDADVEFMTSMVGHHAQALEMAELAPTRAQDARVKVLAGRIAAGQGPEIDVMQAWLRQHGLPEAELDAGHDSHDGMPGMAGPEDLTRLVAARGLDFDRLFLQLMSEHHRGALQMADEAVGASHPIVTELVNDVAATQSVEIDRMQQVLADLRL